MPENSNDYDVNKYKKITIENITMVQKTPKYLSENKSRYKINIARTLQKFGNESSMIKIYNTLKWQFQLSQGVVSRTFKYGMLKIDLARLIGPHGRVMDPAE